MGAVSPCGIGVEKLWDATVEGRSAIRRVSRFDVSECGSQIAGEVRDFHAEDFVPRRDLQAFSRHVHFGVAAAQMAWEDADRPRVHFDPDRLGVVIGSAVAATSRNIEDGVTFLERGIGRVHPMAPLQYPGSLPSQVAITLGFRGPTYAISTACTAGADAIGLAYGQIAGGMLDGALVGGSEAPLFPGLFAAFDRLRVLSRSNDPPERGSRPFSLDRTGFVLSEGAGILMLEAEDVARERGARVYAELAGFGATSDAFHHIRPAPDGVQGARAITQALAHAGLTPIDVDYINAHGTGTLENDAIETTIVKRVFGEAAPGIPVSSSKSVFGHLIGASAAVELIVAALAVRDGVIPPTINFGERDPACDLDYVTGGARRAPLRTVLSTSFGFGSRNAALVLRRWAS